MNDLTQEQLQKLQSDIKRLGKLLQTIQKETAEAQKLLDAVSLAFRNVKAEKPPSPDHRKPQPKPIPVPSAADIIKFKPYLSPDGWIRNKTRERTYNVPPKVVKMAIEATTLKSFFEEFGLQIRDNRKKGGALWVKGSEDFLRPFIAIACKKFACGGTFTKNGAATDYQIGWFTNCKK